MVRQVAITTALAATLAAAAFTPSAQAKTIALKVGDAVDVVGTPIACFAITSNKQDGIACVLWRNGKPKPDSFGAGLSVEGTASLQRLKADGSSSTVIKRKLQTHTGGTVYKVKVGDLFGMQVDDEIALGCRVLNVTSTSVQPLYRGKKVSCWLASPSAPKANSWGISISAKFAGIFHLTARSQVDPAKSTTRRQP